jgi:protein ImuA
MGHALASGAAIGELRRRIAALEGRPQPAARLDAPQGSRRDADPDAAGAIAPAGSGSAAERRERRRAERAALAGGVLPFGVTALDRLFAAGGLPLGSLHEIHAAASREAGALSGFVLALAARLLALRPGPVVWAVERMSGAEGGRLYGPGLNAFGLDPGRLLLVEGAGAQEVLWVLEEALAGRGVALVVGEIRGSPRMLDMTATRRLALKARESGGLVLLARTDAEPVASAAAARFRVAGRPSGLLGGFADGVGRPAWRIDLVKNRDGRLGGVDLEWDHDERRFALAPHPVAVSAAPFDGPADHRRTGQVVALGRGGRTGTRPA